MPKDDLRKLSKERLAGDIASHEKYGRTAQQPYRDAVAERNRRQASSFQFGRTVNLIRRAARLRRFTTIGDLASAYATDPAAMKEALLVHLDDVARETRARNMPLLITLVTDETGRQNGHFGEPALAILVRAARAAGYEVHDPRRFLHEQQQASFEWSAGRAEEMTGTQ